MAQLATEFYLLVQEVEIEFYNIYIKKSVLDISKVNPCVFSFNTGDTLLYVFELYL